MSSLQKPRLTIRLAPAQMQVLDELKEALGCPAALLVRAMILSFITTNEPILDKIVEDYNKTGVPFLKEHNFEDIKNDD